MNIEEVRAYCLQKQGVTEQFPFNESTLVFKVLDKMFALLPLDNPEWLSLKCQPDRTIELRDKYSNIQPAYHLNKKYWNQLRFEHLPRTLVQELIDHSYTEVVQKIPKKAQRQLTTFDSDTTS